MSDEESPKLYLPDDPAEVTQILLQTKVWNGELLAEMETSHLELVRSALAQNVGQIISLFGIDPSAQDPEKLVQWINHQPLVRAINAILFDRHQKSKNGGVLQGEFLDGPLAALDVETTGVDLEQDRIVSFALGVSMHPSQGEWAVSTGIVDPGIEIPEGAANVHGITTERARAEGMNEQTAIRKLADTLITLQTRRIPVIGHKVSFDLTILDRASRRLFGSPLQVGFVLDTLVIDKGIDRYRRGKRTLDATCEHYQVPTLSGHEADKDALRALQLLWHEMHSEAAYEYFMGRMPTLEMMQAAQIDWHAEQERNYAEYLIKQGKHPRDIDTGWPIADLP